MLLLDVTIEGKPISKNARTRYNKKTRTIHTSEVASCFMEMVAAVVRAERSQALPAATPVRMGVSVSMTKGLHAQDLDGMLACLVDGVFRGLSDAVRPPDQWLDELSISKALGARDEIGVKVWTLEQGKP